MSQRTVVVTGGTKGLGRSIATRFLRDPDMNVALCARRRTSFVDEILGGEGAARVHFGEVDISDEHAVNSFIEEVKSRYGSVDILVNNAGIALDGVLAIQQTKDFESLLRVNLLGTLLMSRACSRQMILRRWGRIVNVTSIVGRTGYRGLSVYSMTKAGIDGFTRSLARELGSKGITVNSVAPGFLETEMTHGLSEANKSQIQRRTPLGRLGTGEDVAPLVYFLASSEASFITAQTICIDGGLTA